MALDPRIQATVSRIEERIERLKKIRDMLIEEFGTSNDLYIARARPTTAFNQIQQGEAKKTRRQTLMWFLTEHGPAYRKEIIAGTNMPEGTISYLLDDKETFERLDDGRWTVKQQQSETKRSASG